jgi:superfamily II DNA or RNA helicase
MSEDKIKILSAIKKIKTRLAHLDTERKQLTEDLKRLNIKLEECQIQSNTPPLSATINNKSANRQKISLFRSLFRGREDVYPKLWVSKKSGKQGYSPVCENEWARGLCRKPAVRCGDCENRKLSPLNDEVIQQHLDGHITIGTYPMLQDETCYFLAVDFDKHTWKDDVIAFMDTCKQNNIPASLERSRSGNGGHVWIFFSEPVPAMIARQMGTALITETMNQRHQLDMKSYDRLFPNQDTMPKGGFGNLIALPLQKTPAESKNSIFIDNTFKPFSDQWDYLSKVRRMTRSEAHVFVEEVKRRGDVVGMDINQSGENEAPWESPRLRKRTLKKLVCPLPEKISVVLANRIYINKDGLPAQLLNQIKWLAAFQNPEFYKKQRMRLSTALTPRVICCAEEIQKYYTIPRGCLDDLKRLLSDNNISVDVQDKRFDGKSVEFKFNGELTVEQNKAREELLKHETGVLVAPPGIGKTVIGIRLIESRKTNTLVLVHRKPLLEQWRAQIGCFLGLSNKEIGHIGGGRSKSTNIIDVAMVQSLDKQAEVNMNIKNYGHIIVDECHHIPAVSFENVMMEANARYITGLTATPYRRDGHQPIITMQCGPVRYKIDARTEIDSPFTHKLITRSTDFSCSWADGDPIHSLWPLLINDDKRSRLIVDDVIKVLKEKRSPIVLTERKEHLEILKEKLQSYVKHLVVLHGGMKSSIRKEMITKVADIPDHEERLILATGSYIGEGFDDPRLDTLFLTMPISFKGKIVQYTGRLHRLYKGKTEIRIYDYLDRNVPVLQRMYERRLKAYKALGYAESF